MSLFVLRIAIKSNYLILLVFNTEMNSHFLKHIIRHSWKFCWIIPFWGEPKNGYLLISIFGAYSLSASLQWYEITPLYYSENSIDLMKWHLFNVDQTLFKFCSHYSPPLLMIMIMMTLIDTGTCTTFKDLPQSIRYLLCYGILSLSYI